MSDISVILNVYKRPHMMEKQIEAVLNQTIEVLPENIHVIYNEDGPDPKHPDIKTYKPSWNTMFYGRFTIPLLCKTEYIAVFDDDNLPMPQWFENCLNTMPHVNGILGGTGVIIPSATDPKPYYKYGWNGVHNGETERVDYVGQAWFFRQEWSKYIWYEKSIKGEYGEDIMFSYLAQKYGGIDTFVPPHPGNNRDIWSTAYNVAFNEGRDKYASWRAKGYTKMRHDIHWDCIDNGWNTVKKLKR